MTDIQIASPAGSLQVRAVWQPSDAVVLICHPHPLFGGTMDNKVISTLARFFKNQTISVVTFNFRGVGSSTGSHDQGVGEIDDALTVLSWILRQSSARNVYLAGFSFGAYVAAAVASRFTQQLVSTELMAFNLQKTYLVAPPVHHYPMQHLMLKADTVVVMGNQDEVVPPEQMLAWAQDLNLTLEMIEGGSHFFHGKLPELAQAVSRHFP